jgi:hypothetical protein
VTYSSIKVTELCPNDIITLIDGRDPEDDNIEMVMMKNLTAMIASALKRDAREVLKKSMRSRLSPEAAKVFSLLSAQDWQHKDPNLNSFMKRLISDKDSQRALGIMQTQTKKWSGQVSNKGLMGFFAARYAARDIGEQPGGFTAFVFRPVSVHRPKSRKRHSRASQGYVRKIGT